MARFTTLFSSSSGNSTYLGTSSGGILVDAGKNAKQLEAALSAINVSPTEIKGIFITHEHTDHISAVRVFASRYGIDIYASKGTLAELRMQGHLNGKFNAIPIDEKGAVVAGIHIAPFRTSHDSRESTGYTAVFEDGRRIGIATDTGVMTQEILTALSGCDAVLLESNHDVWMLENGSYPYYLKRRIRSNLGHLSNDDCSSALCRLIQTGTTRIILGHLSKENNRAEIARQTSVSALSTIGAVENRDYILRVASHDRPDKMLIF